MFFTSRACSIACWPSRTSMPSFCSANIIGSSIMSTPSGIFATPSAARMDLISFAASRNSVRSAPTAPRMPVSPARQWSWCSQGACSLWWRAAEPKSQMYGSPLPVSSE